MTLAASEALPPHASFSQDESWGSCAHLRPLHVRVLSFEPPANQVEVIKMLFPQAESSVWPT